MVRTGVDTGLGGGVVWNLVVIIFLRCALRYATEVRSEGEGAEERQPIDLEVDG